MANRTPLNQQRLYLSSRRQQTGIATILIVLMIGLAMTAASLGVMHTVKSTQQKQVTAHTATNAQAYMWSGVEALPQVFKELTRQQIIDLNSSGTSPSFKLSYTDRATGTDTVAEVNITLEPVSTDPLDANFRAKAIITGVSSLGTPAQASSSMEVMFEATNPVSNPPEYSDIQFHDDLDISGQVTFVNPTGEKMDVAVDGNISAQSVSVSGIGTLKATGDIELNSGVQADKLQANGNIDLGGSATVLEAEAIGDVRTNGAASIDDILTNGRVEMNGGDSTRIRARGTTPTSPLSLNVGSVAVNIQMLNGNKNTRIETLGDMLLDWESTEYAWAGGDITIGDVKDIRTLRSAQHITCTNGSIHSPLAAAVSGSTGAGLQAAGGTTDCELAPPGDSSSYMNSNAAVSAPTIPAVQPFSISKPSVDVWQFRDDANYVFDMEGTKRRVSVRNVNGLDDGTNSPTVYYLGDYNGGRKDYLCTAVDSSNNCTAPASHTQATPICKGFSAYNNCFSYSSGEWTINGDTIAPGIMWFKGDLVIRNHAYTNTFLATGNIETRDQHETTAPNYAGPATICTALNSGTHDFAGLFPLNLCTVTGGVASTSSADFKVVHLANIALAAGSYEYTLDANGDIALDANGDPVYTTDPPSYAGGDIDIGASSIISGTVLAGQFLKTGGQTVINGRIYATSQGASGSNLSQNELGANTTVNIDTSTVAPFYTPDLPVEGGGNDPTSGTTPAADDKPTMEVLWSRYL